MKTYNELMSLDTFEERIEYLFIGDKIGNETFGNERWINQQFYKSYEWRKIRDSVIIRDNGCDLGIDGCDLHRRNLIVHHINPITAADIINRDPKIFDMNNLISTSLDTHNYIHFGIVEKTAVIDRSQNDTCPWKSERR